MKISARNQLEGKVLSVTEGAVNAKVDVDLGEGKVITSIISMDAVKELGLTEGSSVTTLIKASNVLLMA
ncbi:TOBE domain-containing protein [Niallia sp. 01092]|uniref:TOBE domain-containing protein n=1 Tax=unclassified Niallia TaxID=2837522 RepID=UPI003FD35ABC